MPLFEMNETIRCKAEITKIIKETPRVKVFRLKPERKLPFIPGQFVMLGIDGITNLNGTLLKRSYSIASSPLKDYIELCIAKMENGIISGKMHSIKEGESVNAEGPYGNFKLNENSDNDILFIAGGSGIAPIMSMIRDLFEKKTERKMQLFFGVRSPEEIIYKEELEKYLKKENFELIFGFSDEGEQGFIHKVIEKHEIKTDNDCYICGPPIMVKHVREVLINKGFEKEKIMVDQW